MTLPELRPRLPLVGIALAAAVGIFLADRRECDPTLPLAITAAMALLTLLRPGVLTAWLLTGAAFFSLHTVQHFGGEGRLLARSIGPTPAVVSVTGVVWDEPAKPRTWSRSTTARFLLKLEAVEYGGERRACSALLPVRWAGPMPAYGDRVSTVGSVRAPSPPRNPGQLDFAQYQRRHGIYLELQSTYASDCAILAHEQGQWLQSLAFSAQRWICEILEMDLHDAPEVSALIESMVLGIRGAETSDDVRELFQRTGTMHLFAVSGLNVMMLAYLAWLLLKTFRVSRFHAVLVIIPLLAIYAVITGLSASCIRASITGAIFFAGYLLDRRALACNSLAAAGCAILAWDTDQLFSTGFQFTFVIVLCLLIFAAPLQRWINSLAQTDPFLPVSLQTWRQRSQSWAWGVFSGAFSVTLVSWASSLVITIGVFHLFSPAALLANLLAVPLAFLMLDLGVAALLGGALSTSLAVLFNNANWFLTKALLFVLSFSATLPGAYQYVRWPRLSAPPAELTVLDAGTGGAVHLRAGGVDWLLDCAHGYEYERIVLPYLRSRGINRLDGLLLSHGDAQHIGGGVALLSDLNPQQVLDSPLRDRSPVRRAVQDALARGGRPKTIVWRGDAVTLAPGVRLTVLFPPAGWQRSSADDKALVVRLEANGRRALFMSDSGFATEQWLMENEADLSAEILVKGQHARDLSGTPEFLRRVGPQVVIAGQPAFGAKAGEHEEWMQSVEALGITLFPQERSGSVHVSLSPAGVEARGFVNGQTFRSRAQ